jgi:hypothetical protein
MRRLYRLDGRGHGGSNDETLVANMALAQNATCRWGTLA